MLDPTPYRRLFPISERLAFFNHAGVSPVNTRAVAAMNEFNQLTAQMSITEYRLETTERTNDLRERIARLINARSSDEIVLMPNTATGINTAALSLPLRPGDNVLVLDGDYPANIYPWMNLAHRGVLTKFVPQKDGGLDLDLLLSRVDSHTRVIAMSTVVFATGFRNDIEAVGKICSERGIFFVVDGIQSLGALPLDVQAANIDFLAAGSQKWLLGPIGAGFLYVRAELMNQLVAGPYVGASSVVDPANFLDYNFTPLPGAERFNLGSQNFVGMYGLHASLALIQEIGIEHVAERVLSLAGSLIADLRDRGFKLAASTAPEHRSGIVIAEVADPAGASARLEQAGFVCIPRGKGVRIAPHFYNTEDEVQRVGEALSELSHEGIANAIRA
ncbi:MAG TPA: aminotransferase class V-fold PLP-dependent enzyme [Kouleothrix sp.]|uniref:aminotransferase class V-fold PLP-dependent enzyme n=1 Tax=Kouleothrix sp. TaxID=2779161 RepID=UPI002B855B80|nr:aminotransferase class V-fold PLP-dependent enzyme [Kouleothrix sp.]HRC74074.1 aminotransferase class V-fold PLP-dependent enzyme [Kouleothrix sp.]